MTLDEMRSRKQELGYSYQDIARLCDLPLSTVQKIFGGKTQSPRRETILKLESLLLPKVTDTVGMIRESSAVYSASYQRSAAPKKQGEYTVEDYYALPDDLRVELIDGVFYDMTAPSTPHQLIAGEIHAQLLLHKKSKGGACLPFVAPVDVQLDCDESTMLQPDVLIVCDRSKVIRRCVYGAPDFVVEVLSPSTRRKDMIKKMEKYTSAGVREYWMVDPDVRKVIVYELSNLSVPEIYTFSQPVPVKIWNSECLIDFTEISELLDELFPESDS